MNTRRREVPLTVEPDLSDQQFVEMRDFYVTQNPISVFHVADNLNEYRMQEFIISMRFVNFDGDASSLNDLIKNEEYREVSMLNFQIHNCAWQSPPISLDNEIKVWTNI